MKDLRKEIRRIIADFAFTVEIDKARSKYFTQEDEKKALGAILALFKDVEAGCSCQNKPKISSWEKDIDKFIESISWNGIITGPMAMAKLKQFIKDELALAKQQGYAEGWEDKGKFMVRTMKNYMNSKNLSSKTQGGE